MKNELIITDNVNQEELDKVIDNCLEFFSNYLPRVQKIKKDDNSVDLEMWIDGKVYELGSYGIRQHEYLEWIYATGVAEPRLTNVINILRMSNPEKYQQWATTKGK